MASQLFHLSIFSPFWPLLLTPTSEPSLPLFIKPKFNHQKPDSALLSLSLIFPTTPQNRREEGLLCFALLWASTHLTFTPRSPQCISTDSNFYTSFFIIVRSGDCSSYTYISSITAYHMCLVISILRGGLNKHSQSHHHLCM